MNLTEFQETYKRHEQATADLLKVLRDWSQIEELKPFCNEKHEARMGWVLIHHHKAHGVTMEHIEKAGGIPLYQIVEHARHAVRVFVISEQFDFVPQGCIIPHYDLVVMEDAETHEVNSVTFQKSQVTDLLPAGWV